MSQIVSIGTYSPPYEMAQESTLRFAKELFQHEYRDIDRLLTVFHNGQIEKRHFSVPMEWYKKNHSLQERNDLYIKLATTFGVQAIQKCLHASSFLKKPISYEEIDAIFFISSSGFSTPSIEARIMNELPFSVHTKRIPIWGLGCAGGASGLARANEYCLAYPKASVLVLSVELCSLTFQREDTSKSNVVGTSLFADGVACVLVSGDQATAIRHSCLPSLPTVMDTQTTLMPHSEDVMGWDVKDQGLHVVFSKNIPHIVSKWLKPNVEHFLTKNGVGTGDIQHFIAHPGGRKVLQAYEETLCLSTHVLDVSREVLRDYGNMSSATVLYVLQRFMEKKVSTYELGLISALGPGFSSELLLIKWS